MPESTFLRLRNLSKSFHEGDIQRAVLQDVNLDVREGELIILLGKSGSGKSTLLNVLSGIDRPTAGSVIVDGSDLTRLSEQARTLFRRRHIGFIFQFFNLIPTLTVEENLRLPLELNRLNGSDSTHRILELLDEVGLADRRKSFPDRLSGGEQQRVAIARALIHDPKIILADEPTGNLDVETGRRVIALLDRLVRRRGKTLIMATHSRDVIGVADRIFSIENKALSELESGKLP